MFGNPIAGGAARGYADGLVESLDSANETITKANRIIAEKNAEIARLNHALAVEQSKAEGFIARGDALLEALEEVAPDHKLLKKSSSLWQRGKLKGKPKAFIRRIYEAAFDKAAKARNISNPSGERSD